MWTDLIPISVKTSENLCSIDHDLFHFKFDNFNSLSGREHQGTQAQVSACLACLCGTSRFPGNSIILLEHCCKNNYLRVTQKRAPVLNTPTSRRAWGPLIVVLKHVPTFPQRENRFVYHVTNGAVGEVGTEILKCHPRNGI